MVVALGSGAEILPGESVTFLGAAIRSANNASAPAGLQSSEYGTYKFDKATFWPWL